MTRWPASSFRTLTRLAVTGLLLAVLALAASCGGGGGSSGGEQPLATVLITDVNSIVEREIPDGGSETLIETPDNRSFLLDGMPSPDGTRIAYVVQPPVQLSEGQYDAGTNIWVADRDGSEQRMVYEHTQPNQLARFPVWLDENTLLAIISDVVQENGQATVNYTLSRVDVPTGERTVLISNVLTFGLSPDGQRVAYSRLLDDGREALHIADIDGSDDRELVGPDRRLQPIRAIRFSPDGSTIAFASAEQPEATRHVIPVAFSPAPSLNGLPEDIWTIPAAGGDLQSVADIDEDLPSLTWSADGSLIYVLGTYQLYAVHPETQQVDVVGAGVTHGEIALLSSAPEPTAG